MNSIFINYRRCGDAYAAALLDERLSTLFDPSEMFRAGRSIAPGADYEVAILKAIEGCSVMLTVVGPQWAKSFAAKPEKGKKDWVHLEIVEAFKKEIPVIPVLLSGAERVTEGDVPADISQISRSQYLRFDYRNLDQDCERIALELHQAFPGLKASGNLVKLRKFRARRS